MHWIGKFDKKILLSVQKDTLMCRKEEKFHALSITKKKEAKMSYMIQRNVVRMSEYHDITKTNIILFSYFI